MRVPKSEPVPTKIPEGCAMQMDGEVWDLGTGKMKYGSVLGVYTDIKLLREDWKGYRLEYNRFHFTVIDDIEKLKGGFKG